MADRRAGSAIASTPTTPAWDLNMWFDGQLVADRLGEKRRNPHASRYKPHRKGKKLGPSTGLDYPRGTCGLAALPLAP